MSRFNFSVCHLNLAVSGSMSEGATSLRISPVLAALVSSSSLVTISQEAGAARGSGSLVTSPHSAEW